MKGRRESRRRSGVAGRVWLLSHEEEECKRRATLRDTTESCRCAATECCVWSARRPEARAAGLRRQRSRAATCLVEVLAGLAARGSVPLAAAGETAGFVAAGRERAGFCRPLRRRVVAAWPSTWGCLAVVVVRREQNGAEKADKGRWLVFPLTILY